MHLVITRGKPLAVIFTVVFVAMLALSLCVPGRFFSWVGLGAYLLVGEPSGCPQVSGKAVRRSVDVDTCLIFDSRSIGSHSLNYDSQYWSYAWLRALEQEVGGQVSVVDGAQAESVALANLSPRLVIVSRSATEQVPVAGLVKWLDELVSRGAVVVLELPGPEWFGLSQVLLEDTPANASGSAWQNSVLQLQSIPHLGASQSSRRLQSELLNMPMYTWLKSIKFCSPLESRLGSLNGETVVVRRQLGRGQVLSFCLDLSAQMQSLQQGVPTGPGWKVIERGGLIPGLVESQDLVMHDSLTDCAVPYADVLENYVMELALGQGEVPTWWRFPYQYDGAVCVTHDEERLGASVSQTVLELDASLGVEPSVYVVADAQVKQRWGVWRSWPAGTKAPETANLPAASRLEFARPSLGVHWSRFWPFASLVQQASWLQLVSGAKVTTSRIHYLCWGNDYVRPFREMAACGITLDSSYGPNNGRGYLFGTGLPFQVLDSNGCPLPIYEMPFLTQENWGGVDSQYFCGLIDDSARYYHQTLALLLHPHRWVSQEAGQQFLKAVAARARQRSHWLVSQAGYMDFWLARLQAKMRSQMRDGQLVAHVDAPREDLAVCLSAKAERVLVNGKPAKTRLVRLVDSYKLLVAVPGGHSQITAQIPSK